MDIENKSAEIIPLGKVKLFQDTICERNYFGNKMISCLAHMLKVRKLVKNPKILEIGGSLMVKLEDEVVSVGKDLVEVAFEEGYRKDTPSNILYEEFGYRSCVVDICKKGYFEDSDFVHGDFLEIKTQENIIEILGGKPNIIIENMVFVSDLIRNYLELKNLPITSDNLPNKLASTAWKFLEDGGYLMHSKDSDQRSSASFLKSLTPFMTYENLNTFVYKKS